VPRMQRTIGAPVELTGIGLFTGAEVKVRFVPAEAGTGVVFCRTDLPDRPRIRADVDSLAKRMRRTSLRNGNVCVETVEHVLAALAGVGVDNAVVELSGPEVPAMDGSCETFRAALESAGLAEQDAPRPAVTVTQPVSVTEGDSSLVAMPSGGEGLSIVFTLEYPSPINQQNLFFRMEREAFKRDIAPCRTFVLESEAAEFKRRGLGMGASFDNTVVYGAEGVVNGAARFPDECVRHKVQDLVGDLFLLNRDLNARVVAVKSGHHLNVKLVRELHEQAQAEEMETRTVKPVFTITDIQKILPHRYPFLLLDRVIELDGDHRAVAIKNVTYNEPFFQGHWPGQPVMPAVLQIEAMAQLAGVLLLRKLEHTGKLAFLMSIDRAKIRRPVVPGDQLRLEAVSSRTRSRTGAVDARAWVGDKLASEAHIKFILVDADST
jgi:UDP-3-O-[3-hydroxymyristoyl] N-acetylglucosamine deacetylase/3-hydroxyacyl-[acyl-carrier-protein] dehydratase